MLDVPVVLVAFNRPDHVRRALDGIRRAAPRRLFVLADAPRQGRQDDADKCAAVRTELDAVDWDCQVQRRYAKWNMGCEANIESGLDWVFAQVDRAIVLEDDCVADPTFFRFCAELLERYASDERVWQIAGSVCDESPGLYGDDSYAFTRQGAVWGWATWARAWQAHRKVFIRTHDDASTRGTAAPVRTEPPSIAPDALATEPGLNFYRDVARSRGGDDFGWDAHFWLTIVTSGGFAISPAVNMVENIGMGAEATHTVTDKETIPARRMDFPLRHPASMEINKGLELEQELHLVRGQGRLARIVGRIVGRGSLRRLLSRISSWHVTWRIVRALTAVSARLRRR